MYPTFFKIYGMKLNEEHFSSGTVISHFLDKPYQEINFKGHLNSVPFSVLVYCQTCTCPV